jgi:hypothetical protein
MRPKSIVWFERLYVAAIAIEALVLGLNWWFWESIMPGTNADALFAVQAAWRLAKLVLVLCVARLRSRIALSLLILLALWMLVGEVQMGWTPVPVFYRLLGPLTLIMSVVAIGTALTPEARAWFRGEWPAPSALGETFE